MRKWILMAAALVVIALLVSAISYGALPSVVATHWDIHGQPNGWSSRAVAVSIVPLIMIAVTLAMAFSPRPKPEPWSAFPLLVIIALTGVLCFHGLMLGVATGRIASASVPRLAALLLSIMLIGIGNYLPRTTERNLFVGVRWPWAFSSAETWRRSQRLGGYSLVASGLIGLFAVALIPKWSLEIVIVTLIAQMVYVSIASYRMAHSAE
jgi:uncharacterized membrane protein